MSVHRLDTCRREEYKRTYLHHNNKHPTTSTNIYIYLYLEVYFVYSILKKTIAYTSTYRYILKATEGGGGKNEHE